MKKLEASITRLNEIITELDRDLRDKSTAYEIDQACTEKIEARRLEKGEAKPVEMTKMLRDGDRMKDISEMSEPDDIVSS